MAELQDRMSLEEEFFLRMLSLWDQRRQQLKDLIGFPPTLDEVTNQFWPDSEEEDREELVFWLAYVFFRAAMQHGEVLGVDEQQARVQSELFARQRAFTSASSINRHSQRLLNRAGRDWGQGSNQSDQYLSERLDMLFGEDRLERVASTETSEAASAGAEWAVGITGNLSPEDIWYTALDERVCPYCGPLHLQPRYRWSAIYETQILPFFPQGAAYGEPRRTPAHIQCRCFINYYAGVGDVVTTS